MPFTPIHMGPGLLFKAVLHRHFSWVVFGWAQIFMDIEPLVRMIRGDVVLHGFSHTLLGALLIGAGLAKPMQWLSVLCLRILKRGFDPGLAARLSLNTSISFRVTLISSLIGTLSHVLFDGVMHSDLHPFAPWSGIQPWHQWIDVSRLHLVCLVSGIIGAVLVMARLVIDHRADKK